MHFHRSLAIGLMLSCVVTASFFRAPCTARAAASLSVSAEVEYPFNYAIPSHPKQTAVKPGDTFTLIVYTHDAYTISSVDADFSAFGIASLTPAAPSGPSYGAHGGLTFSDWYAYIYPPITVGTTTGIKNIPVHVVDGNGDDISQTVSVTIDTTPPALSLSGLTFSTSTPRAGDSFLLSGSAHDAGSLVQITNVVESLTNASGTPTRAGYGASVNYNIDPLTTALASSTDGSFANVPFTLQDPNEDLPESATFTATIFASDGAGNIASTSVSVALPPAVPPPFPPSGAPVIAMSHAAIQPYRTSLSFPGLGDPKFFVATGTLQTFVAPIARFHGLAGTERYSFALADSSGALLDCATPEKTADEWGITHKVAPTFPFDWDAPYVVMGPFSGTQCQISAGSSVHVVPVRSDSPREALYVAVMGDDNTFQQNFIAYGVPVAPAAPKTDSVLFIPGTETSRLYYRDSLGVEHELWEPANATEIPKLAMNPDGSSVNAIYTKDIIDHLYGNRGLWGVITGVGTHIRPSDLEVYGDFETYMDSLVASSTLGMHEWRAYPYDWRYDVRDIVNNGTLTEAVGSTAVSRVYLEDVIDQMASSSATGQVAIVAHSNGGLIAKALMQKLEADGKGSLVDKLALVGTPQWGTPDDLGAMLHGDGYTLPPMLGLIAYGGDVRQAAETMPGPYDLLPSPEYFAHVSDPVAVFAGGDLSTPFKDKFVHGITSFADLVSFVTDAFKLDAGASNASLLNTPLALDPLLVSKAQATHAAIDAWTPPAGLSVTAIAGWGQLTNFAYAYTTMPGHTSCVLPCTRDNLFVHTPVQTEDGDNTVVTPSAVGGVGNVWYFNSKQLEHDTTKKIVHQDLTSAVPIQNTLLDLLEGKPVSENYIVSTKPPAEHNPLTIVGGMSPVNLLATDSSGNVTGIVPFPGTDFYYAKQDIPGSAVSISGNEKFITLPQGAQYSVSFSGYDSGPANLLVQTVSPDGTVTDSTTVADIPVTAASTGSFSLDSSGAMSTVTFDASGDGTTESITPAAGALVAYTPPAPVPSEAPAGAGAGSGGGGGAISLSYIASVLAPTVATTTATTTAPVPVPLATTTSSVATSTPLVAASTTPVARSAPPVHLTHAVATSTATTAAASDLSETAAAANALSHSPSSSAASALYHWVSGLWASVTHFFTHML